MLDGQLDGYAEHSSASRFRDRLKRLHRISRSLNSSHVSFAQWRLVVICAPFSKLFPPTTHQLLIIVVGKFFQPQKSKAQSLILIEISFSFRTVPLVTKFSNLSLLSQMKAERIPTRQFSFSFFLFSPCCFPTDFFEAFLSKIQWNHFVDFEKC